LKTVDYSTRSVISAGRVKSDLPVNQTIKFSYTGIPLSHLCNLFFPFFQYEIKSWAEETFMTVKELKDTKGRSWRLLDPMGEFTPDKITKMLSLYIKSPEHRLDRIYIDAECQETGVKGKIPLLVYKESLKRDFTILDLIFIVAHKVCKDKHVYVTRYPVENFMSIFPSRIKIVTTYETMPLEIDNKYFEEYPVVAKDEEHPNIGTMPNYVDTVIPHNSVLESLGADFDGDTVSIRSVYTQEANIECEKIINSLKYILDLNGKSTRVIRNEGIQTLYTLTRDWN
jgi:DNA-directed RNA polymerase beta' subunit